MFRRVVIVSILALVATEASAIGPNVLVNGDFETSPPANLANNIGWPITPWVLGTSGQTSNVVKVDGNFNYGTNGPWRDASGSPAGVKRHYLDIANGSNDFYQPFTPPCEGQVEFGGFFSTRANSPGKASIKIVQGVGTGGTLVGATNTVNLAGGNSANDPWTPVSYTANLVAGQTYSFVVSMDNNMNFDEAFVRFETDCTVKTTPTPTPTQPPAGGGCAQVTGEARCLPGGGYSYTFSAANNTGGDMAQILVSAVAGGAFSVSPQLFNLSPPIKNGQSTTQSANIGNVKPGEKVCFFVTLMSDKTACCTVQVCPTLPVCANNVSPTPQPKR